MPIRLSGMNSGLDTDSIVQELVAAQRKKVDTFKKQQTSLQWKQDAWKTLNSKILKLFDGTIKNLRFQSSYTKKTTKVSNSSAVNVITGGDAVNGVQSLRIDKVATTGYLTGEKLSGAVSASTKLSDLSGMNFPAGENGTLNVMVGGASTEISVGADSTVGDVVQKLRDAGLDANFDEKNQRFFINSKESGEEADFSITSSNETGNKLMSALGIKASLKDDPATLAEYKKYADYYVAGDRNATLANMQTLMDKESASRVAGYKAKYEGITSSLADYQKKMDAVTGQADYDGSKTAAEWKTKIDDLSAEYEALPEGAEKEAKKQEITDTQKQHAYAQSVEAYQKEIANLNNQKTDVESYVNVTVDGNGKVTDAVATGKLTGEVETSYYNKAEYAAKIMTDYNNGIDAGGATKMAGEDAVIYLNGAEFKSSTNNFEINGLTLNVTEATGTETITLTTQDDTDGVYNLIKDFFKEYNSIINEMDKLYNSASSKGYDPLTSEERESMSEDEIKKWEEKIKDSLLRRDSELSAISSTMKEIMMSGATVNGKKMYLSDFGINTLGFFSSGDNEKNAYHIDGDSDDASVSSNPDVLKGMIASDPDTVVSFFASLQKQLYDGMNKMMTSNEYRSMNTVYSDKQMKKDYEAYTKKIAEQEKKIAAMENKWYKKFTAMETALAKMQSNQSAISGLLGG